jgi:predicted phosphoadenosine phosphosulfate sulfurtransferase
MAFQIYSKDKTVLDAAIERISFLFDHYEHINVSVSGGKDSTVLAYLALAEAERRNRKVSIFFLDEEVVYDATISQVEWLMEELCPSHTNPVWLQIPFNLTNATSLLKTQFMVWEEGRHKDWMRPKKQYSVKKRMWALEDQIVADKNKGFGFYDVFNNYEKTHKDTAFLVGMRATESPNRWRAVSKNPVLVGGKDVYYGTAKTNGNASFYPLYDWNFHDVWRFIADEKIRYSRIYDYQFMKGFSISEIRCSSLIHERSFKSLCELPEFEPKTFERLCKRIEGISIGQETGKDSKMFKAQKLPKNFKSWMAYRDFLMQTYLDETKKWIFEKRFARHLNNEFVARQQCRQLVLNDYENNLPVSSKPDPREELLNYYKTVL